MPVRKIARTLAVRTPAAHRVAVRKQMMQKSAQLKTKSRVALLNRVATTVVYQHDNGE